ADHISFIPKQNRVLMAPSTNNETP
ncbi:hypothetical protein CEXT_141681, partial [Caerostris extrusa]